MLVAKRPTVKEMRDVEIREDQEPPSGEGGGMNRKYLPLPLNVNLLQPLNLHELGVELLTKQRGLRLS